MKSNINQLNQEFIRNRNLKRVLRKIIEKRTATIKDLASELDLSVPTIISVIDDFLSLGLIEDCGLISTKNGRGRKPICYCLNANYKYIVSVDLGRKSIYIGLANLWGELIDADVSILDTELQDVAFVEKIIFLINKIIEKNDIGVRKLASIVVGNAGVVDENTGEISYAAGNAIWDSQPLKLHLQARFPCDVVVKNDVNTSTIGELKYGIAVAEENFAFFRFDVGVKAGIVINGKLFEGSNGAAGEIGFSVTSMMKDASRGESRLENEITVDKLCKKISVLIEKNFNSPLFILCHENNKTVTPELLGEFYQKDHIVNNSLSKYIIVLGNLIINFTAVIDLPIIILGGDIVDFGNDFLADLQKYVDKNCFFAPEIKYSSIKEHSGLLGATYIGINMFVESITQELKNI
ncbi:MAG: ROK family transcriptional regulator [Clostridiaceae bacterium]|nr:ROK family transcriptional regulator [Clostridiaceae bacterium]